MKYAADMIVSIIVDKEDALVDEVINITLNGLQEKQHVTVRAEVNEKGQIFAGSGCFVADDNGTIDISTQPSTHGTYEGVSQMGLFWSMRSAPGMAKGMRLITKNASAPLLTDITVFPGHLTFEETYTLDINHLSSKKIRRWYMAKGVQKIKVRSGRIRGTLFLPPGRGPFPGVIDMFGVVGSCIEFRAALLASRGFASIALAYFLYEDLPNNLEKLELEYFMEAVDWLSSQTFVDGDNIGVIGVSKGGEVALNLGFYSNKIKSVVSVNGGPFFTTVPMLYKGEYIGRTGFHMDRIISTEEGLDFRESMHCEVKDYVPIWTKDVNVLLICGLDDRCLKPEFLSNLWKRYPTNRKHLCKLYKYPGAGHLIEPSYAPLARFTAKYFSDNPSANSTSKYFKGDGPAEGVVYILWGGETVAHAHAQEDSWKRILNHFRTTLQKQTVDGDNLSNSKLLNITLYFKIHKCKGSHPFDCGKQKKKMRMYVSYFSRVYSFMDETKDEAMTAEITVDKEDALVDEVIKIIVKGLKKNQQVTVKAEVTEKGQVFAGSGCFVADDKGTVDVCEQSSAYGTYKGVSLMGLFWSMKAAPGMPKGMRLIKYNASSPIVNYLTVYPGHITFEETFTSDLRPLCNKQIRRWYMAKGVQKRKIRSGRIRGTLFLPPGKGPFPGVIDMFGIAGSCIELRAALLASRGFASIALPYFMYDDLPRDIKDLEMEYFLEAVDWFSEQPFVDGNNLGVIGVSKGGEIALHLGFLSNKIKSVVSINGGPSFTGFSASYKGKPMGTAEYYPDRIIETEEGLNVTNTSNWEDTDYIPIWTKDVHVLLICGLDDLCYNPKALSNLWSCYPTRRKHLCKLYNYAGAGHLIEPPYAPLARTTKSYYRGFGDFVGVANVLWGGETVAHARAQEDSWKRILNHFQTTLKTSRDTEDNLSVSKL
ncbi:uncharacterized protein LOC123563546 [Mercenaria mercenaria]|uniref:uncharacterized protein LOC123563546 n=1 Tax=Mercenaria mercenaria TaxID=6596 RepID=UPI00234E433D|nr:uncharacterized protein LOC123563546 [Mercenaria mercenaria]